MKQHSSSTRARVPVVVVSAEPPRSRRQHVANTLRALDSTAGAYFALLVGFLLLTFGGVPVFGNLHSPRFPYLLCVWVLLCCAEAIALLWIKRELDAERYPLAPHLAVNQWHWPLPLRPVVSLWWLAHFFFAAAAAVALDLLLRGEQVPWWWHSGMYVFGFIATYTANLYLLLAASALTRSPTLLHAVWRSRLGIDVVVIVIAWAWPAGPMFGGR